MISQNLGYSFCFLIPLTASLYCKKSHGASPRTFRYKVCIIADGLSCLLMNVNEYCTGLWLQPFYSMISCVCIKSFFSSAEYARSWLPARFIYIWDIHRIQPEPNRNNKFFKKTLWPNCFSYVRWHLTKNIINFF